MTELPPDIASAVRSDGFIDYYELLGVPGNASQELINMRINDLYSRAQSNREHRHIAKRREAEMLLELMPHCMDVLMDAENRIAYDHYAIAARAGAAPSDFETFMNDVIHESPQARAGLLGVREGNSTSNSASTTAPETSTGAAASNDAATSAENRPAARSTASRSGARQLNYVVAAIVFVVVFVLSDLGLRLPPAATMVAAPIFAMLAALFTSRPAPAKKSRNAQRVSA